MKITTIGIDLAKEMFQIHGVDTTAVPDKSNKAARIAL